VIASKCLIAIALGSQITKLIHTKHIVTRVIGYLSGWVCHTDTFSWMPIVVSVSFGAVRSWPQSWRRAAHGFGAINTLAARLTARTTPIGNAVLAAALLAGVVRAALLALDLDLDAVIPAITHGVMVPVEQLAREPAAAFGNLDAIAVVLRKHWKQRRAAVNRDATGQRAVGSVLKHGVCQHQARGAGRHAPLTV